jgi:hypothetical protein
MGLIADTEPKDRELGPVRRTGCFLCAFARCCDRAPLWARIMNGRLDHPDAKLKVGNLLNAGSLVSSFHDSVSLPYF